MYFPSVGQVSRSTRLSYRLLPRHHFRLPDRYKVHEDQIKIKTKRENEKAKEGYDKPSHNTLQIKSIMLTCAMPKLEPPRYSSSLYFSLPKVPTSTPSWLKNVRDDFYIHPNGFHLLRGLFPKNIIIPRQSFPIWSVYRTSFSKLPTLPNSKSSLPFSYSTVKFDSKLTLLYAGVLNSWSNSLQLEVHDVTQKHMKMTKDAKDTIYTRNGQRPKHLKFHGVCDLLGGIFKMPFHLLYRPGSRK